MNTPLSPLLLEGTRKSPLERGGREADGVCNPLLRGVAAKRTGCVIPS